MAGLTDDHERIRHHRLQHIAFEFRTLDELLGTYLFSRRFTNSLSFMKYSAKMLLLAFQVQRNSILNSRRSRHAPSLNLEPVY
jgi:hypothetical protein